MEMSISLKKLKIIAENIGISLLPAGFSGIATAMQSIKSEEELSDKLSELKESADSIPKRIPLIPMSIEVETVTAMIMYFFPHLEKNDTDKIKSNGDNILDYGICEFHIEPDYLLLSLDRPVDKDDVKDIVAEVKEYLKEYDISIKAVAYL